MPPTRARSRLRSLASGIGVPIAIALLIRATLVQAYHIPSGSMEDTLFPGDFVLAEKVTFGPYVPGRLPGLSTNVPSLRIPGFREPHPGEIIIFEHPEDPEVDLIKRCIAVEDQVVEIRDKQLFVDGRPIGEIPGLKHTDPRSLPNNRDNFGPFVVPPGHVFLMGDNRDNSFDSRFFGAVPVDKIRARPLAVYFSWNATGGFLDKIRWRHLGPVH